MKHVGVGWFAGWLFESVVSPLWVARDWSGSFNCVFHVKHQSSQQLVGEGRRTQSHPQQLNHQPTTFHVKQSQLQNHEGKAENSRLENTPPPSNYSHDQCFTWNLNWSFKLSHTSKPQNPTNTSKQITSIPTPSRFTWNTKPQQPIGERQRTLNAISCNSTIRSCFTWNHSSIFRTQQTYVSRETSGKLSNIGKAQH